MFPLKLKLDVCQVFIEFKVMIENLVRITIKSLQTDNGGEFIALESYLKAHGIVHHKSCPSAHQQMGVVERRHRHIVDTGLSLLNHAELPFSF